MEVKDFKSEAHRIVEGLPDSAGWRELGYECYGREQIERGLKDAAQGKTKTLEQVFAQFGVTDEG